LIVVSCFKSGLVTVFRRNTADSDIKRIFQKNTGASTQDVVFMEFAGEYVDQSYVFLVQTANNN
jgi:hypothetical protein